MGRDPRTEGGFPFQPAEPRNRLVAEFPHDIQFALAKFGRDQLPPSEPDRSGDAYCEAVRDHLAGQFAGEDGAAQIVVTEDRR